MRSWLAKRFPVGTRSLLFGAHCFFLHPFFVALGWWRLYGFPWDPRLWLAFIVHDWGYWGKPNLDGPEGEEHPKLGAQIMGWLFDRPRLVRRSERKAWSTWYDFSLLHSRYFAKRLERSPSRLCYADKMAILMEPRWLYLPRVRLSGELREMLLHAPAIRHANFRERGVLWHAELQRYVAAWIETHKDGAADTWTTVADGHGWEPLADKS